MTQVLLVLSSLGTGGAERQALELAAGLCARGVQTSLVVLHAGGALEAEARERLGKSLVVLCPARVWRKRNLPVAGMRLVALARKLRPRVVYGFQPVVNELALIAARVCGAKIVWGIRFSNVPWKEYGLWQAWAFRLGASLSGCVDALVTNSEAGLTAVQDFGYSPNRSEIISNGIDGSRFAPSPEAGRLWREQWGIAQDAPLIGQVGRMDMMKDWPNFLRAAALVHQDRPELRVACVGPGIDGAMSGLASSLGLGESVVFPGQCFEMSEVYNALDALVLSSAYGEGFPNVVGESMACGTPCVVTNVGDAAAIVGETGFVVPVQNEKALAKSLGMLLGVEADQRREMEGLARQRVLELYSLDAMVEKTNHILVQLTGEA